MKVIFLLVLFTSSLVMAQDGTSTVSMDGTSNVSLSQTVHRTPANLSITDAVHGDRFVYVSAGSLTGQLSSFEVYYREYLLEVHNIASIAYGCDLLGPELQFMNQMNKELKAEYGDDFIDQERSKAKILFEKTI